MSAKNRWRRIARRFARRHGYFWLPCPLCGQEFGGQEWSGSIPVDGSATQGRGICPSCTGERQTEAERRLRELGESLTIQTTRDGRWLEHVIGAEVAA